MSNFEREYFNCRNCGEEHRYETLIEYPLPENISNVSSGKSNGVLRVISKYVYSVDRELFLFTSLVIPIVDLYDDLEIRNWVKVDESEWRKMKIRYEKVKTAGNLENHELVAEGVMVYPIPFYGMSDYPAVKIAYGQDSFLPVVELAISSNELYKDWKNGISKARLERMLSFLYHV